MKISFEYQELRKALHLLNGRLQLHKSPPYNIIVCGGSALIATSVIFPTTKDIDIVALLSDTGELIDPAPLPPPLIKAAIEVAEDLNLPPDWLNNGPSSGDGGIFRLGLPENLTTRLIKEVIGEYLTVFFVGRKDQIFFKFYASVDRFGGYHAADLFALKPSDTELIEAIHWTKSHDPSEGFHSAIEMFLKEFGYERIIGKF